MRVEDPELKAYLLRLSSRMALVAVVVCALGVVVALVTSQPRGVAVLLAGMGVLSVVLWVIASRLHRRLVRADGHGR